MIRLAIRATLALLGLPLPAEPGRHSSGTNLSGFTRFTQPVVALGKVFPVNHDAHVYAFGLQ